MANRHRPRNAARGSNPDGGDQFEERADVGAKEHHQEALLDQAIEETFPASDPISPMLVN